MQEKVENQCDLNDIRSINDGKIVINEASEILSQRIEKSTNEIYELIITCKSDSIFPAEIGQLVNIQTLTLVGGDFKTISLEIGKLKKLELLILLNTSLENLPLELYRIPSFNRMAIMYNMNEFTFQQDLCEEDFKLEVSYTSSNINELPTCLKQSEKIKLISREAY